MVKINPVKATCQKCGPDCELQGLNDNCFEICAAFSGTTDPYNMDPECTKSCEGLIEQKKIDRYGVGSCDHQAPYKPVIWNQTVNYLPQLLRKGYSPQEALNGCYDLCKKYAKNLTEECISKCDFHYSAIEEYDDKKPSIKLESPQNTNFSNPQNTKFSIPQIKKQHPVEFWLAIALIIVGLCIIIYLIIKYRNLKNSYSTINNV